MKYSYNWLRELVPKLPKPEKLADLLNLHAFEVESVEPYGKDFVLDISILPNRIGDAAGHIGMARDIAAILGVSFSLPRTPRKKQKRGSPTPLPFSVRVADKKLCRRYMGSLMVGVTVRESPSWLKERLEACGLRPINNVVDATNYSMLLTGQPLHAFDYDKLGGHAITVRLAKQGERITTLDGVDASLRSGMLVIADDAEPLAIAGIKGGTKAEITESTTRIVLEAATFDSSSIRRTAQAAGIRTDSSVRFSVGLSAVLAEDAAERAIALMGDVADASAPLSAVDIYPKKERLLPILLRHAYAERLLGTRLKEKEITATLTRLGCAVTAAGSGAVRVTPPLWRRDLVLEEDLIEEVGRIHGYAAIQAERPLAELIPPNENNTLRMQERIRDMLAGAGFQEVYNYSFVGKADIAACGDSPDEYPELENPARPEFAYLRTSLGAGLLKNTAENLKHQDAVQLFEIGRVFAPERTHAGGVIAQKSLPQNNVLFFELKGALSLFFEQLGVDAWFDDVPSPGGHILHPHRAALIKMGEECIGSMGEVHPRMVRQYGIQGSTALFELDADVLGRRTLKEKEYRPISRYPSVMRDVSLLAPPGTRTVEVLDVLENTGGELLVDTDLIDMYAGPELPDGKKNFVFRLVFQAQDRTLTDGEVAAIVERITKALEETNLEWEVR